MAFNIEADPREQRNAMAENDWVIDPFFEHVGAYHASLQSIPTHRRRTSRTPRPQARVAAPAVDRFGPPR
jgi:hypothetical protein